jgi:hypothetical protein
VDSIEGEFMSSNRHPQYNLRIPNDLKEWLKERAERNYRSLNAEIVDTLRRLRDEGFVGTPKV